MASAHPSFPPRSSYASGKLPDRSALNTNPLPFGSSALSRRDRGDFGGEGAHSKPQPHPPALPAHAQQSQQQQPAGGHQQNNNPLNDLTEEQREEINEAVSSFLYISTLRIPLYIIYLLIYAVALSYSPPPPVCIAICSPTGK